MELPDCILHIQKKTDGVSLSMTEKATFINPDSSKKYFKKRSGKKAETDMRMRPADSGAAAHVRGRNRLDGLLRILVGGKTGGSGDDEQN